MLECAEGFGVLLLGGFVVTLPQFLIPKYNLPSISIARPRPLIYVRSIWYILLYRESTFTAKLFLIK